LGFAWLHVSRERVLLFDLLRDPLVLCLPEC
jgi:hypothetical protein